MVNTAFSVPVIADEVRITPTPELQLQADYRQGRSDLPAVLLLHGFLQTHQTTMVRWLSDGLAAQKFNVLAPTLSLGISERDQTLACDALHLQSMQQDINELALWVEWLLGRGHSRIVLLSYDFGAVQLLAYMQSHAPTAISQLILVNPVDVEQAHVITPDKNIAALRALVAAGDQRLIEQAFLFCARFPAPAAVQLSYREWSGAMLVHALQQIRRPVRVILGGADHAWAPEWPLTLQNAGALVQRIPEAQNFLRDTHRNDLLASILTALAIEQ